MTSGRLGIRDLSWLRIAVDHGDGGRYVAVKAWTTAPVTDVGSFFRRRTLVRAERVEPLEHEAAVVAEELVQADHSQEKDRVVIVTLNPLALASWTLHWTILRDLDACEAADQCNRWPTALQIVII